MADEQNPQQLQSEDDHSGQPLFAGYSEKPIPLTAYAGFIGAYVAAFGGFLAALRSRGQRVPKQMSGEELLLLGVATHKLARLVTKDWVTSPLRAPFTRLEKSVGEGELQESARGTGVQRALGELLTCPWCMAPWTAAALAYSWVFTPRLTRLVASMFTMVTISDFLQHVYEAAKKLSR